MEIYNDENPNYYTVHPSFIINTLIFVITLVLISLLFKFTGKRYLDKMALFLMFSYLTVMGFRFSFFLTSQILRIDFEGDSIPDKIKRFIYRFYIALDFGEVLLWILLSIFVLKMQSVKLRLKCENLSEFSSSIKSHRLKKNASIVFMSIYALFVIITPIVTNTNNPELTSNFIRILAISIRSAKFLLDFWLYSLFI
jgi:hypothetical protein